MYFKDIPGKVELKSALINTAMKGRIPHAQIFLAKEGFGGLPLALAFASYIMCENKQPLIVVVNALIVASPIDGYIQIFTFHFQL